MTNPVWRLTARSPPIKYEQAPPKPKLSLAEAAKLRKAAHLSHKPDFILI